ncbi:MAG: 4Fe-4S binding protein [Candidatus Latescibacteria bacterium]|nr:4Fe-4S binding protein [Candidatus Latescibacterota bacterium]
MELSRRKFLKKGVESSLLVLTPALLMRFAGCADKTTGTSSPSETSPFSSHIKADRCIGCSACVPVCPHSAIALDTPSLYAIDPPSCVGCGACKAQCPHDAITADRENYEITSNCNGCGKCETACPHDAMHIVGKKAVIDYEKCQKCGECYQVCNRNAILIPRLTIVSEKCEHCGECYTVCEHDAVRRTLHTATLDASLCDQCGKCVEVCSQNAIVIS